MTKFADHLFEDLMAEHGATLTNPTVHAAQQTATARRRVTRPVWTAAGGIAATAAAVVGFTVFGAGTAAAYAVTENPNGTLTVAVKEPSGVAGANGDLQKRRVQVAVVQAKDGCVPIGSLATPDTDPNLLVTVGMQNDGSGAVTVDAKGVPKGFTFVIAFAKGTDGMQSASVLTNKAVPSCVSIPKPRLLQGGETGVGDGSGNVPQTAR